MLSCILLISAFAGADASDISIAVSNMTLTATKFTPEVLLTAPRRSPAVPNAKGTKALFTVSWVEYKMDSRHT